MQAHVTIHVNGKVQGVGFRPFISILANQLQLSGYAMNQVNGLIIYLFGEPDKIDKFEQTLLNNHPKHALITTLTKKQLTSKPSPTYQGFEIRHCLSGGDSDQAQISSEIPADRALCKNCLYELFDPTNKRFLQPFITCIDCGPRASIIEHLPYDRINTSHHKFAECDSCLNESLRLIDKQAQRFHSQTNSCWECGPTLSLFQQGKAIASSHKFIQERYNDYFDKLSASIHAGKIIALKGLGGFHLFCDARNSDAVNKLRNFKHRPDKPFAVMSVNPASLSELVNKNEHTRALLEQESAPIVMLPKQSFSHDVCESLAPRVNDLGCIVPYTAIHYRLFYSLLGKPAGHDWLSDTQKPLLVVTSANNSGEPLICDNQQCIEKISEIAEYILCHDRDILLSSDDSVIQGSHSPSRHSMVIRRGRGFAPEPIKLPFKGKPVLAFGAHLKNTFCLSGGQHAYLSPHLGEPESIASIDHLETVLAHYLKQFSIRPEIIACDKHPDFLSTQLAKAYAEKNKLPLIQVPHHQAHIAAALSEASLPAKSEFIALALDGIGLGESNTSTNTPLWGGELFIGKLNPNTNKLPSLSLNHYAQLSQLSLPGGDQATKEIGRIGFALLESCKDTLQTNFESDFSLSAELKSFIQTHLESFPKTSALGRWFDAVSALIGLRQEVSYEGQAAMELEALAAQHGQLPRSKQYAKIDGHGNLDLRPILPAILSAHSMQEGAAIFHSELIDGLVRWASKLAKKLNTQHLVCSGGCFQNRILRDSLFDAASEKGLIVHYPKHVPPNDAGISLGQALLASLP